MKRIKTQMTKYSNRELLALTKALGDLPPSVMVRAQFFLCIAEMSARQNITVWRAGQ